MANVTAYHRPSSVAAALELLDRADVESRVIAGGTTIVADRSGEACEVVDLQAVGLADIDPDGSALMLGAMASLAAVAAAPEMPALLAELAHREAPWTFRNQATVGGAVMSGSPDSMFVAGLLVHGATVEVATDHGEQSVALAEVGPELPTGLITSVTVQVEGVGAHASTGRTPADTPIVGAVGRRDAAGEVRLALTGVAVAPVLVDPGDPTAGLDPPPDFRGSRAYRLELARVHSGRVLTEIGAG